MINSESAHRCLSTLQRVNMQPHRYSQGMAAITALKKIDAVRVDGCVERNGKLYYVIDVYLQRPESRIPTNVRSKQQQTPHKRRVGESTPESMATRTRAPDFQVERRFSDFTKLRSKAYREAQSSHRMLRCSFCEDIVNSTLLGTHQPKRFMNVVFTSAKLTCVLTGFVNDLLEMTRRSKRGNGCRACTGQEQIPQLLCAFVQADARGDFSA